MTRATWPLALTLLLWPCSGATAQPQVFTSDTTISCSSTLYENKDIVVDATGGPVTLTVNCQHTFKSLRVQNGAVVTHSSGEARGLDLTITGDVFVDAASRIDVSGRGHTPGVGPGAPVPGGPGGAGGASHGGNGSAGGAGRARGPAYSSLSQPAQLGSGGGNGAPGNSGGAGGGFVRLTVGGTCTVNGALRANGQSGPGATQAAYGGGGSGGSIWLSAQLLAGFGSIEASGGGGQNFTFDPTVASGAGGGGRIALEYSTNNFVGTLEALGGVGSGTTTNSGGAGTIFLKDRASTHGDLLLDNAGSFRGESTDFSGTVTLRDLTVRNTAVLSHRSGDGTLFLDVRRDATIASGAAIDVSGRGEDAFTRGPGAPPLGGIGGASHGGQGASGLLGKPISSSYGAFKQPRALGSAGGTGTMGNLGGSGGGLLRLTVAGTCRVDGLIAADGVQGAIVTQNATLCGGGAGGSVEMSAGTLAGLGEIRARGGDFASVNGCGTFGGAGGGGRIAVRYTTNNFVGLIHTRGGFGFSNCGAVSGGAGTVYLKPAGAPEGDLIIDNQGQAPSRETEFSGQVIVRDLRIDQGGILSHAPGDGTLLLDVQRNCIITSLGRISVDGKGHAGGFGPGAGTSVLPGVGASGAGHGGLGAASGGGASGGFVYGSVQNPASLGSGGGNAGPTALGGAGGGRLELRAAASLQLDGRITANGGPGLNQPSPPSNGGGGSGGSILIRTPQLLGVGLVEANGGTTQAGGASSDGGGGGGGRIAIHAADLSGFIGRAQAAGGTTGRQAQDGAAGTVFGLTTAGYLLDVVDFAEGKTASFVVTGAQPNQPQCLLFSLVGTGSVPIPQCNITLGLGVPFFSLLPCINSSSTGMATWRLPIPIGLKGIPVWVQAAECGSVSNVFGARIG